MLVWPPCADATPCGPSSWRRSPYQVTGPGEVGNLSGYSPGVHGRCLGAPGGGWGDKEASYSFPSGQGPGGGVSRPLGKRRRVEPEPLRRRQKGKMEELGPPSTAHHQPHPQEPRERARLQRALQVGGREPLRPGWCGKEWRTLSQVCTPPRPRCLRHPPALTRVTRAAAATTSGPQMPAACPGQCSSRSIQKAPRFPSSSPLQLGPFSPRTLCSSAIRFGSSRTIFWGWWDNTEGKVALGQHGFDFWHPRWFPDHRRVWPQTKTKRRKNRTVIWLPVLWKGGCELVFELCPLGKGDFAPPCFRS